MKNKSLPAVFIIAFLFLIYKVLAKSYQLTNNNEEIAIKLDQNHPNPFSSLTEIQYFISTRDKVKLTLVDINGREVANLIDRYIPGGWSTLIVNGSGLSNGIYILRFEAVGKAVIKTINKLD